MGQRYKIINQDGIEIDHDLFVQDLIKFLNTTSPYIDMSSDISTIIIKNSDANSHVIEESVSGNPILSFDTSAKTVTIESPYSAVGFSGAGATIFETTAQTITGAGTATIAHGLGAEPDLVQVYLECTTADQNYSVGDKLHIAPIEATNGGTNSRGIAVVFDSTNIFYRLGSDTNVFKVLDKTTGTAANLDNASWDLYIKAIKL